MPIESVVDSIDSFEDPIKELYKPGEGDLKGKYILDVKAVDGFSLTNPTKLKSALDKERDAHKDAQSKLKLFEGIDPKEAKEALEKISEIDNWDPDKKNEEFLKKQEKQIRQKFESENKQISKKLGEEIAKKESRITSLQKQLEKS